jgi:hypothetical protein
MQRGANAAILILRRQFLAEPRHCPIELMQVEPVDAGDAVVVLAPAIRRAVGAANEHSKAKPCLRASASSTIAAWQPVSAHSRSNSNAGPMRQLAILTVSSASAESAIALVATRILSLRGSE